MAGTFAAILNADGTFTINNLATAGDRRDALQQCHQIIALLVTQVPAAAASDIVEQALGALDFPVLLNGPDAVVPAVQPELTGAGSIFRVSDTDPKIYVVWDNQLSLWWGPDRQLQRVGTIEAAGRYSLKEARQIALTDDNADILKAPEAVGANG